MRFRKNDPAHNLLAATQHWLRANGGYAVVIGGIGVLDEEHPLLESTRGKFQICVKCLGQKPTKENRL